MQTEIYLDHAATGPLNRRVAAEMLPWLGGNFGNPSALYERGRLAAQAVERARATVAAVLGCRPSEVVFTSGGSESINAAIKGIAFAQQIARLGSHVVVSAVEHHAVLHSCEYLEKFGFEITQVGVDASGRVSPESVAAAVRPDTVLVSVMHANNEVGTVQPVAEISAAVRERAAAMGRSIPIHSDAVQSPLWLSVDLQELGVDALSLSAHKFGGPTGAGILVLRRGVPFLSQQSGGGQERQRRAGTENVAGIVGTAAALELAEQGREERSRRIESLRDRLAAGIRSEVGSAVEHAVEARRLPSILSMSFPHLASDGEHLVGLFNEAGIAVSSGSACASQSWEPSHVLLAMGLPLDLAASAIRFSLGPETSAADIDEALARIPHILAAEPAGCC